MRSALILLVIASLLSTSCSLFDVQTKRRELLAPIQDKPFKARETLASPLRKRIVVLPFFNKDTKSTEKITNHVRQTFLRSLAKSDQMVIVPPDDLQIDLHKYRQADFYDLETLVPAANTRGVSSLIEGKIIEIKTKKLSDNVGLFRKVKVEVVATVQLRMASVKSNKVVLDTTQTGVVVDETTQVAKYADSDSQLAHNPVLIEGALLKAFHKVIPQIVGGLTKMGWQGRVAMVQGERIFINAGRLTGLQLGDILKVTEKPREVYDPDSGALIGEVPGRMKGTIEVINYFGKDGAVGLIHSGSGFVENDIIELY